MNTEEKKIVEIQDKSMEEKLSYNKVICKVIETIYMQELFQSVVSLEKLIPELSPEEYLKVSEMIRDDFKTYNPSLVLELVKSLRETKFEEYLSYVILNIHYYLYLFRHVDYVVTKDIIEVLDDLKLTDRETDKIRNSLIFLIRQNIINNKFDTDGTLME